MGERDKTLNRTLKIYLGIAILLFAGFGSVLATNISINPAVKTIEYGEDVVDLTINSQGLVALTHANSFHSLAFDSRTSVYTIEFLQPTILANDVGRLLIQSSNANED